MGIMNIVGNNCGTADNLPEAARQVVPVKENGERLEWVIMIIVITNMKI